MKLSGLLQAALADPALTRARDLAKAGHTEIPVEITAPPSLRPFVVAAAAASTGGGDRPVLAVTATSREAEDLAAALGCLLPADQIVVYPAWETLPHERLSPRSDTVGRRLAVLRRLAPADRLWAPPCRELLLPGPVRERARQLADKHPELAEILEKLADGIPVEGMESLGPALLDGSDSMELLLDTMPRGTYVVLC